VSVLRCCCLRPAASSGGRRVCRTWNRGTTGTTPLKLCELFVNGKARAFCSRRQHHLAFCAMPPSAKGLFSWRLARFLFYLFPPGAGRRLLERAGGSSTVAWHLCFAWMATRKNACCSAPPGAAGVQLSDSGWRHECGRGQRRSPFVVWAHIPAPRPPVKTIPGGLWGMTRRRGWTLFAYRSIRQKLRHQGLRTFVKDCSWREMPICVDCSAAACTSSSFLPVPALSIILWRLSRRTLANRQAADRLAARCLAAALSWNRQLSLAACI